VIVLHGSIPGFHDPLSTLRTVPRGTMRMTRGQSGSLALLYMALASTTPHRSPGALPAPQNPPPFRFVGLDTVSRMPCWLRGELHVW
jgi:hypothetical protein